MFRAFAGLGGVALVLSGTKQAAEGSEQFVTYEMVHVNQQHLDDDEEINQDEDEACDDLEELEDASDDDSLLP